MSLVTRGNTAQRTATDGAATALTLIASEANRNPQALDAMRTFFQVAADMGLVKPKVIGPSIDANLSLSKRNQSLSPFHALPAVAVSSINDSAVVRRVSVVVSGAPAEPVRVFPQPIVSARSFMGSDCLYVAGLSEGGQLYVMTVKQQWKSGLDVQNVVSLKYHIDCKALYDSDEVALRLYVDESAKLVLLLAQKSAWVVFLGEESFGYGPQGSATIVSLTCRDGNACAYPILNRATNATAVAFHSDTAYYRAIAALGETTLATALAAELDGVDTLEATYVAAFGWVFRTSESSLGFARINQPAVYSRALSDASIFSYSLDGVRTAASPDGDRDSTIVSLRLAQDEYQTTVYLEIVTANGAMTAGADATETGSGIRLIYVTYHYVIDGAPNARDVVLGPIMLAEKTRVVSKGKVQTIGALADSDEFSGENVVLATDWWGDTIALHSGDTELLFLAG
jgi:hypothetical protein